MSVPIFHLFFYIFLFIVFPCGAHYKSRDYPHISKEIWEKVEPYFLPPKIPIKNKLDKLFLSLKHDFTKENLINNKFIFCTDHHLHIHALKHPSIKGYIIKLIPLSDKKTIDWELWIKRIEGAKLIKKEIKRQKYENLMVVPKKWIYPIHKDAIQVRNENPQYFALVATDMNLLSIKKNHHAFRTKITMRHLHAIFSMATLLGLSDSCKVSNIPWTVEGKLAYVDTEAFHQWPVNYHILLQFLSHDNQKIWKKMTASINK